MQWCVRVSQCTCAVELPDGSETITLELNSCYLTRNPNEKNDRDGRFDNQKRDF